MRGDAQTNDQCHGLRHVGSNASRTTKIDRGGCWNGNYRYSESQDETLPFLGEKMISWVFDLQEMSNGVTGSPSLRHLSNRNDVQIIEKDSQSNPMGLLNGYR